MEVFERNKSDFLVCQRPTHGEPKKGRLENGCYTRNKFSRSYRECFMLASSHTQIHNLQNVTLYAKNKMIKYEC